MVIDPDSVLNAVQDHAGGHLLDDHVKLALIKDIRRRMTPQPLKIRADVEITCFEFDGVENIRAALKAAEATSTVQCEVKASLVASPLYVFTTHTADKVTGINAVIDAIAAASVS